jgi:hypothetical protein
MCSKITLCLKGLLRPWSKLVFSRAGLARVLGSGNTCLSSCSAVRVLTYHYCARPRHARVTVRICEENAIVSWITATTIAGSLETWGPRQYTPTRISRIDSGRIYLQHILKDQTIEHQIIKKHPTSTLKPWNGGSTPVITGAPSDLVPRLSKMTETGRLKRETDWPCNAAMSARRSERPQELHLDLNATHHSEEALTVV